MERDLISQLVADSPKSNKSTTEPPYNSIFGASLNHSILTEIEEEDEKSYLGTNSNSNSNSI